jgi:hypothetical protein
MAVAEPKRVTVCTWEPQHTLTRVEAQQAAVANGTIGRLIAKHGKGAELRAALSRAGLVSITKSDMGEPMCAECNALMDTLLSNRGIVDKVAATRDVVENFDKAIERTRDAKARGEF